MQWAIPVSRLARSAIRAWLLDLTPYWKTWRSWASTPTRLELELERKPELELKLKLELELELELELKLELKLELAENYVWFIDVPLKPP